jgi:outer membrane lipoprotein-sorting protein
VSYIGTSNQKIRLTIYADASDQTGFTYIVNSQNQAALKNENGTWVSTNYNELNNLWGAKWTQTLNQLKANWTGNGNVSFKNSFGDKVTITNVVINPDLPDSTFEPTT